MSDDELKSQQTTESLVKESLTTQNEILEMPCETP